MATLSGARRSPRASLAMACLLAALAAWLVFVRLPGGADGQDGKLYAFSGEVMGTIFNVKVAIRSASIERDRGQELEQRVTAALTDIDAKMSTYKGDSELSRFNQSQSTDPFAVSRDTVRVFEMAQRVSEASGGAFDITVGPLVNAWGFGPEQRPDANPSDEEIARLRERVGYRYVSVDTANSTIRKARPDIYCDLSAIAKGYAVDKAAEAIEALGYTDYMVEVGGEVRARGVNANGEAWRIGIEKPDTTGRALYTVVGLADHAVATSGDYRNYYERNGERYSHTIDPQTGRPITHKLASASVIDSECAMADGYATALMALGPEKGFELAEREGLAVMLLIHDGNQFIERHTRAFEPYIIEHQADAAPGAAGAQ